MCARGVLGTGRCAHMLCCGLQCAVRVRSSHVWRACGQCRWTWKARAHEAVALKRGVASRGAERSAIWDSFGPKKSFFFTRYSKRADRRRWSVAVHTVDSPQSTTTYGIPVRFSRVLRTRPQRGACAGRARFDSMLEAGVSAVGSPTLGLSARKSATERSARSRTLGECSPGRVRPRPVEGVILPRHIHQLERAERPLVPAAL
mmetsp:Transcript_36802/g.97430  ORF Transcript_36802/g.97430 Transcript_36802/m.97430 type:complete len:203 (-) Transcript_36802:679-1287(-)